MGVATLTRATGEATQHREDESFHVLEGRVAFVCTGDWLTSGPGAFMYGPQELLHGFKAIGEGAVRMLVLCTPAGFERFVPDRATLSADPPPPADVARMMASAERRGIDIHGPLPTRTHVRSLSNCARLAESRPGCFRRRLPLSVCVRRIHALAPCMSASGSGLTTGLTGYRCGLEILGTSGRGDWIRTSDPLRPRQVRYQAALRPDRTRSYQTTTCDRTWHFHLDANAMLRGCCVPPTPPSRTSC